MGNGAKVNVRDLPLETFCVNYVPKKDSQLVVRDVIFLEGWWNWLYLMDKLPINIFNLLEGQLILRNGFFEDAFYWGLSSSCEFSVKSVYWHVVNVDSYPRDYTCSRIQKLNIT